MFAVVSKVAVTGFPKIYTVGTTIPVEKAIEIIKSGRFVQAVWRKQSGELVSRNVRYGVNKTLKGGRSTVNTAEYLPVTDMAKYNKGDRSGSWINIKLSTLLGVVVDGKMNLVY
jgi:hypothetical protein